TSAAITTLGLIVGLHSGTHSKSVILGGILTIAIADAFSDALGIHVSEESRNIHAAKHIWAATAATLLSKFFFALTFAIPILIFPLSTAIVVTIIWGMSLLVFLSYAMATSQGQAPWKAVAEHVVIAVIVVAITHGVGYWVKDFGL
ncbi:MAG TPA: hypothetical protein PLG17_00885, partial [Thermodesulfobacteriota bacterium]|nr:hypothetical protein [Thermodesulfobacteriota bacterium]